MERAPLVVVVGERSYATKVRRSAHGSPKRTHSHKPEPTTKAHQVAVAALNLQFAPLCFIADCAEPASVEFANGGAICRLPDPYRPASASE